jgi:hypothetical protein
MSNFTGVIVKNYKLSSTTRLIVKKTELICKDGSYVKHLIERFPSFHSGYIPTFWCFPSILNTIIFAIFQRCIKHDYERYMIIGIFFSWLLQFYSTSHLTRIEIILKEKFCVLSTEDNWQLIGLIGKMRKINSYS